MIIYVYPNGEAHTVDQAHIYAQTINTWKNVRKTVSKAWAAMKEAVKPIFAAVKLFAEKVAESWPNQNNISGIERIKQKRRKYREGLKTINNRGWEWHSKKELKSQTKYTFTTDWQRSKRYRHQQR